MQLKQSLYQTLQNQRQIRPIKVFCIVSTIALFVLCACFLFSRGTLMSRYFFYDIRDTGMDFFHSIEYVRGRQPYELFNTLYPPLANLLFYLLYRCIPLEIVSQWPADFSDSISMRGTELDLRTYQAPMILFLLFVIICCVFLVFLLEHALQSYPSLWAKWAAICMLLSHGMMTSIERGNILFMVAGFSFFYVLFYDSRHAFLRELALIALAIAAGLKLYPALLGVLLLAEKRYKMAFRAVIYGILSVIAPCILFHGGLSNLLIWKDVLFSFGSGSTTPWLGTGFSGILHRIALYADVYLGLTIPVGWFGIAAIVVTILLLLCALSLNKKWQSVLACVLAIILFHSQGEYIYCLMLIPMALFLQEEKRFFRQNIVPFLGMLFLIIPLPLFNRINVSYPRIAVLQAISLYLLVWCIIATVGSIKNGSARFRLTKLRRT